MTFPGDDISCDTGNFSLVTEKQEMALMTDEW